MQCPDCGYMLSAFDKECSRCKQYAARGLKPPTGLLIPADIDPEPIHPDQTASPRRASTASPAEVVFLEAGNVLVTSARAVIGGKTYAMANVTSVAGVREDADRRAGFLWGIIAFGFLLIGAVTRAAVLIGSGLLLAILAVFLWVRARPVYRVQITSAAAETEALRSFEPDEIARIVTAINEAIIKRG